MPNPVTNRTMVNDEKWSFSFTDFQGPAYNSMLDYQQQS